jgi:nicotinamidase-related amidase
MTKKYPPARTALLIVDPYNDFMSEGGKFYEAIKPTADESGMFNNLRKVIPHAREVGLQIFILPHHRSHSGDFDGWQHMAPLQQEAVALKAFAEGTWGGEFNTEFGPQKGDVIVHEHWGQSGFSNTDLDQQLKQHDIRYVILVGVIANSCIESTGRFAMELGYHVTLVPDAAAAFSAEGMHAAFKVNGPTFAHEILTTDNLLERIAI